MEFPVLEWIIQPENYLTIATIHQATKTFLVGALSEIDKTGKSYINNKTFSMLALPAGADVIYGVINVPIALRKLYLRSREAES